MIYGNILRHYWEKCVEERYHHSKAKIRLVQYCAVFSATAEPELRSFRASCEMHSSQFTLEGWHQKHRHVVFKDRCRMHCSSLSLSSASGCGAWHGKDAASGDNNRWNCGFTGVIVFQSMSAERANYVSRIVAEFDDRDRRHRTTPSKGVLVAERGSRRRGRCRRVLGAKNNNGSVPARPGPRLRPEQYSGRS